MALFGPSDPNNPGLMSRLFGGGNAGNAAAPAPQPQTPTAQVAEQTGATASSPFLQYLQANAPAAQQTAQALMGAAPEADYRAALIQAGLGILSQPGGQSPLQAIAAGAQTAMPLFLQEQQRVRDYDQQVQSLAAKLNMGAAEFDAKMQSTDQFVELGGNVVDNSKLKGLIAQGVDSDEAIEQAIVIPKSYEKERMADALARVRKEYRRLKGRPEADPEQLTYLSDQIEALEAQIFPQRESKIGAVPVMTADGNLSMVVADSDDLAGIVAQFGSERELAKIKESREATAEAAAFTSRLLDLTQDASIASMGRVGGLASKAAAWSNLLDESLTGERGKQFSTEVKGRPLQRLNELYQDPEARAYLDDGLYERLVAIGERDGQILSNILGLGYATAKTADEGGKLSDSDVALNLSRLGYDLDAWLNDPGRLRKSLLETFRNNVNQYRMELEFAAGDTETAEKMVQKDVLLNKILPEYGFQWEGGMDRRGELTYRPAGMAAPADDQPGQMGRSPASVQPPSPAPSGQPVQVQSKEQFDQLPSGTRFVAPDGSVRVKP